MKSLKINLLILFILFSLLMQGQNYYTLVDTNKVWNVLYHSAIPPFYYSTQTIKFSGDTMINTKLYFKVFTSDSIASYEYHSGYIRETSDKSIYFKPINQLNPNDTLERLLYDFSKLIGDTVLVQNQSMKIHHIDSVLLGTQIHRRFYLYYTDDSYDPNFCEKWIEGVGSLNGVLNSSFYGLIGGSYDLLCYSENGNLKYQLQNYSTCYYNTYNVGIDFVDLFSINNVKLNLVNEKLHIINNNNYKDIDFEIYELNGKKLLLSHLQNNMEIEISLAGLSSGLYIYKIFNSVQIKIGKLLINK